MKHRPIIVDECCSPQIAKYLEEMGEEIVHIKPGTSDNHILHEARKLGAYIISKDKGFQEYERLVYVKRDDPLVAYNNLLAMKKSEKE